MNQHQPCRKCIGETLKITERCRAEAVARAVAAEAKLDALEAQLHADERPHRVRMRLAEAEVERLRAHIQTAIDHWTNGTNDQDMIDVLHAALGPTAAKPTP